MSQTQTMIVAGGSFTNPMTTNGDLITRVFGVAARLAIGAPGTFLSASGGGLPFWAAAPGFANPMTTLGDIITGGAAGAPTRLAIGATENMGLAVRSGVPGYVLDPDPALLPPLAPSVNDEEFTTTGSVGAFTWRNQGGSTATVRDGKLILIIPNNGAVVNNIRIFKIAGPPAGVFRIRTRVTLCGTREPLLGGGLVLHNVAAVKSCIFLLNNDGFTGAVGSVVDKCQLAGADVDNFVTIGGVSLPFNSTGINSGLQRSVWLQLRRDATPTYFFDFSTDGVFFRNLASVLEATIMAGTVPDEMGFYGNAAAATGEAGVAFDFFRYEPTAAIN
jgi:hypothetical protein